MQNVGIIIIYKSGVVSALQFAELAELAYAYDSKSYREIYKGSTPLFSTSGRENIHDVFSFFCVFFGINIYVENLNYFKVRDLINC